MNIKAIVRRRVPKRLLWRVVPARLAWAAGDDGTTNFGDELSPLLIEELFKIRVVHSGMDAADLVSTGSLMEWAEARVRNERPIVWGSGFIQAGGAYTGRPLDVRAVRGALSRHRLPVQRRPVVLGDPALLASVAFPRRVSNGSDIVGVVPHFVDQDHPEVERLRSLKGVRIIDVRDPPMAVIDQIVDCRLVVSSSLHGLIVADSYGIPNVWTRLGDGIIGGEYKFHDYYSAFGVSRSHVALCDAISTADTLVDEWSPLPGLERIQQDLLHSW